MLQKGADGAKLVKLFLELIDDLLTENKSIYAFKLPVGRILLSTEEIKKKAL